MPLKLPYGVTEANRQWVKVIEDWLKNEMDMKPVRSVSQLFVKRNPDGKIQLLPSQVTDDLLFAGTTQDMEEFVKMIPARVKISKENIDAPNDFNCCTITLDEQRRRDNEHDII